MKTRSRAAVVLAVLLVLGGCAVLQDLGARIASLTPVEKATWMMGVYNSVAAEYVAAVRALPEGAEIPSGLVAVRRLLALAHPLIQAYVDAVDVESNTIDDVALEACAVSAVIALITEAR